MGLISEKHVYDSSAQLQQWLDLPKQHKVIRRGLMRSITDKQISKQTFKQTNWFSTFDLPDGGHGLP